MTTFEWIIGLLLAAVALSALARRLGVPYPTFLAAGGALLAFVPASPSWTLDPSLALALFVAPVLLDAAYDTSLRDLRANWLPVSMLVVAAVAVTTVSVAVLVHHLMPDMSWAAAIALGAIVAPPDAAAATAVLRQVNLPYRIMKVLEGESLLNDASALLIYRIAVGTVAAQHLSWTAFSSSVALVLVGSVIAGYLFAKLWIFATPRFDDAPSAIIMQFVGTFTVWIVAERLELSGILTMVVYAVALSQWAPARTSARLRVPSYAVWETVVFILNVLAFIMIGLQLRPIWSRLDDAVRWQYSEIAGLVLITVILARIGWVAIYQLIVHTLSALGLGRTNEAIATPSWKGGVVAAWCGMRGIVTLATAFALPDGFPYRDLILLTAFGVVLGSLVLQGLTLRPLILALNLKRDDVVANEVARAHGAAYRAALEEIEGDPSEEAELLRLEYRGILLQAEGDPDGGIASSELPADPLRRRAIAAARKAILNLRQSEAIGDDAFHQLEEELDRAELGANG
ncbi:MAG TPA: sodium:proton antiporter [Bradyrhizobium sp.]|nr:sodium:proton antiporter [Bradyrhizobium sp.]